MLGKLLRSRESGVVAILLVMVAALEIKSRLQFGHTFFTPDRIEHIPSDFSFVAIAAIGAAIVILSNGIDLSSGSIMGLGACAVAYATVQLGWSPAAATAVALAGGLLLGGVNGVLHAKFGLPPFIATLGMLYIARGIAFTLAPLAITVSWKTDTDAGPLLFRGLGDGTFLVLVALTVLSGLAMAFTRWGRYVYAIGGNEEASRFSGVPVERVKIGIYAAAGFLSALAGVALALKYGSANSGTAKGYELNIIAAVVVGGISLSGGQGSVAGAVLGALVMQLLNELLTLYDVNDQYIQVWYGFAILAAVALDQLARRGWFARLTAIRRTA